MLFEWDDNKAESNLQKHGISFVAAIAVFDDPNRLEYDSTKPEYGEVRIKTIGMIKDSIVVVVVHTDRKSKMRIISARRAKASEKERYYNS
ncbi:MAG: BrnT family toxin [Rickettsiales bacterium]